MMHREENLGVLVDKLVYWGIPFGRTGYENIAFYEDAAKKHNIALSFFQLSDIDLTKGQVQAYVKNDAGSYRKTIIPVPKVIHNRGLYFSKKSKAKVDALLADGKILYNPWNRFLKLEIHNLLWQDPQLRPYLPETYRATKETINAMLEKYKLIILKPNGGSLGHGLMKLERTGEEFLLTHYSNREKEWKQSSFSAEFPQVLLKNISGRSYAVQEFIPLAKYKGCVYNLRVAYQKNGTAQWQVTGVVGKLAHDTNFVTNIAKGGKAYSLDVLLENKFNEAKLLQEIEMFCFQAAKALENEYPGLADLGIDLGVTKDGNLKLIECNGRGLRLSFKDAQLYEAWRAAFETPILYGKYLLAKED
ncbi:YheC/YheD family endospore coat-associated protein [Dethiobacter alkaliphilus]|uniref:ATP-grasp domain-containing protein n=1 Tax=Dethiobacter alkaliphilus AHT 1 TaxID=555088 RepID=C0GCD5_DETAL|nr:YheC/YheD family protein [Dethiobacter alkaliphilus]EEG78870.1 hypothetical protein DealDRAFT_0144 [Dethiobacter alkaliphilus AHT 1]